MNEQLKYNVQTLTIEELANLIAQGDNFKDSQIRIKKDGTIFLSYVVGMAQLDEIAGRFETFRANNDYVGAKAAKNENYIKSLFLTIKEWLDNPKSFIDIWVQV